MRLIFAILLCLAPLAALAADDVPSAGAAAQEVIASQIEAMRQDDGATAYSFAAPEVQLKFPSPEIFMSMVKGGYRPVYKPRKYTFSAFEAAPGGLRQLVEITAEDGSEWLAEYSLRLYEDGRLRITGCRLVKREGVGA